MFLGGQILVLRVVLEEHDLNDVFSKLIQGFCNYLVLALMIISNSKESYNRSWFDVE